MRVEISGPSGTLRATPVAIFDAETISSPTDAPSIRNDAHIILRDFPHAEKAMLVTWQSGRMMFLVQAAHRWFDVSGQPLDVKECQ